jgi:lycopene beta-cyclase
MNRPFDIAFVGAGLSAMSLAVRLAALPRPPRLLLIDPLAHPLRDRTWCHWQLDDDPFSSSITHRWNRWTIRHNTRSTTSESATTPYARIPSDRFHTLASEKLSAAREVTILRGVSVTALETHPGHTALHLSDGQCLQADWVFDTRPPTDNRAPWRQIFRGLELHSPEARIDTGTVTLMDFQSAGSEGIRFFYILPLDPHTALVEDTWLVPRGKTPLFSDSEILAHTSKHLGAKPWQILHREEGNLPMGQLAAASANPARILPWGTPAGAVRASSGYAYSRIQRASAAMATHWSHHQCPDPHTRHESPLLSWMDRVFLRVMDRYPEQVPDFFLRLFTRVPSDALIRFLESEPRPSDIFKIMRALPTAPFLAAALR